MRFRTVSITYCSLLSLLPMLPAPSSSQLPLLPIPAPVIWDEVGADVTRMKTVSVTYYSCVSVCLGLFTGPTGPLHIGLGPGGRG